MSVSGRRPSAPLTLSRWGVLLLNLGTPKSPATKDVRRYLNEFLMDPFVIDLSWPLRFLLVKGFIAPFRSPKSAALYKKIWTPAGSPLFVHSKNFRDKLAAEFTEYPIESQLDVPVVWSFRYGEPHLAQALAELRKQKVDRFIVLPMYPQYAESSTLTSFESLKNCLKKSPFRGVKLVQHYYQEDFYIDALVDSIFANQKLQNPQALLLTYHSLPVRHIVKASRRCESCVQDTHCKSLHFDLCYRGQCYETSKRLEKRLKERRPEWKNLPVHVSFQSKLTREPWLTPSTEARVQELIGQGVKKLMVVAPGFSVDCLETLEELDMTLKKNFLGAGGTEFDRIPCLNADAAWVARVRNFLKTEIEEQLEIEREDISHAQNERAAAAKSPH